jgi:hypothetical protein
MRCRGREFDPRSGFILFCMLWSAALLLSQRPSFLRCFSEMCCDSCDRPQQYSIPSSWPRPRSSSRTGLPFASPQTIHEEQRSFQAKVRAFCVVSQKVIASFGRASAVLSDQATALSHEHYYVGAHTPAEFDHPKSRHPLQWHPAPPRRRSCRARDMCEMRISTVRPF